MKGRKTESHSISISQCVLNTFDMTKKIYILILILIHRIHASIFVFRWTRVKFYE
jgi:hypothetical protein